MYHPDAPLMPPLFYATHHDETDSARHRRYQFYLNFYNGQQWQDTRQSGERRVTINYARTIVHKGASYLMGKPVRFELIPHQPYTPADAARAEELLQQVWLDNALPLVDYDAAVDAAVLGDCAFKITRQEGQPTVRSVDCLSLTAEWRNDDLRTLRSVTESYPLPPAEIVERWGAAALPVGFNATSTAPLPVQELWTASHFTLRIAGNIQLERNNPYGFIPYVIVPNLTRPRQFWGLSDLEDILTLNSELNVRVSLLSQLLQMSGNPVLVLENVDGSENIRVGPGAVWNLPEGAKASLLELLSKGGVELHLQYIRLLYQMLHDLAELPGAGFGRDDAVSARSGVAVEQLLYPVVQRVNRKRRLWDWALDRRNRLLLRLMGLPEFRSRIIWPDILPRDRAALVTQEVGLVAAQIHSLQTARRTLGDEQPDLEDAQILSEGASTLSAAAANSNRKNRRRGGVTLPPDKIELSGALINGLSQSGGD